jgi:DNA-binding NarL/FixJ family response regulator
MLKQQRERETTAKQEILFVDDEQGVREGWKRFLSAENRTVTTAADGESAISGLSGRPIDLVISDLRMPGVDGLDVLEWVHENKPETRFVLITGYGSSEVEQRARRLGAFGYLEKPVHPDQLAEMADAALRGEPSTWEGAIEDAPVAAKLAEPAVAAEALVMVPATVSTPEQTSALEPELQLTLRDLGRLALAPFKGFAFIVFLPLVAIAVACYAIGTKVAQLVEPIVHPSDEEQAAALEPALEPTLRNLGKLALAPFKGFAFIVFLPVIGIAAACYAICAKSAQLVEPILHPSDEQQAAVPEQALEPTLGNLGKLALAPFKGLAFIVCLPVIVIAAACYAIGAKIAQLVRLAGPTVHRMVEG